LIPEVAFVELPPMNLRTGGYKWGYEEKKKEREIPLLVEKEDICPTLEKSMCSREASKTATYNDDLCHEEIRVWLWESKSSGRKTERRELSTFRDRDPEMISITCDNPAY
jgi:hypothetical protein